MEFPQHTEASHDCAVYLLADHGVIWVYSMSFIYFGRGPEKPLYYYWPDIQSVLCLSPSSAGLELQLSTSRPVFAPETWAPTKSPSVLEQSASQILNGSLSAKNETQTQAWQLFIITEFSNLSMYSLVSILFCPRVWQPIITKVLEYLRKHVIWFSKQFTCIFNLAAISYDDLQWAAMTTVSCDT